jgi:hypothetical protein
MFKTMAGARSFVTGIAKKKTKIQDGKEKTSFRYKPRKPANMNIHSAPFFVFVYLL